MSTILWLLSDFLYMKTDVKVPSQRNKHTNFGEKFIFIGILSATYGNQNPYSEVSSTEKITDPQHWLQREAKARSSF